MEKELCKKCGNLATYWYMPGYFDKSSPYHCENCVPRNCECNHRYVDVNAYFPPLDEPDFPTEKDHQIEWIEEGKIWCSLDEKGRHYPCCEYMYDEEGFDIDDEE